MKNNISSNNRNPKNLEKEYSKVIDFAKNHYENFPVLSLFTPKHLQKHVAIVYWFARTSDDIVDEGNFSEQEREKFLNEFEYKFDEALNGKYAEINWELLENTISEMNLSAENFHNLLIAFRQDITKKEYQNFDEVLGYCKNSADPVGRIILELYEIRGEEAKVYSDKICTGLQLANFYQDVKVDLEKDRIYLATNEMVDFNVNIEEVKTRKYSNNFKLFLRFNVERTQSFFAEGRNLLKLLPFRLRLQILVTILGGEAILKKIEKSNFDVLSKRPKLTKIDFIKLFSRAIFLGK